MSTLMYKGYMARVEFDAEDEIFVGHIAGINDVVGFHAENSHELKRAFQGAVDDYLETCAAAGKTPEKPYSGKMMLRIDPKVHARAALAAQLAGMSMNQWGEKVLREAAERVAAQAVEVC